MNLACIIVGGAGSGKTTLARQLVVGHLRAHPQAIALAHDPVGQYARRPFASADELRAAILAAARDKTTLPRLLSVGGSSEDMTRLAMELGRHANRADRVKRPILAVYDEASLLSGSGATHMGRSDQEALAIRRHLGVGSLYLLQRPQQLPEPFWMMATEARVFAGPSTTARKLEELFLLERGDLSSVMSLRRFHHLRVSR